LKQLNAPFDKVPDGHGAPNSMFEIYILPELMTDSRSTLFGTPAKVRWTKVVVMANHGSERLLESNNIEGPVFPPNSEAMGFYSTMGRLSLGSEEREY
jgi:hypothetical protein